MQGIVFDRVAQRRSLGRVGRPICNRRTRPAGGRSLLSHHLSSQRIRALRCGSPFAKDGTPAQPGSRSLASSGDPLAGAIAVRSSPSRPARSAWSPCRCPGTSRYIEFGLGRKWVRHYTRFFDRSGTNAWKIARIALEQGQDWSRQIDAWQKPYIENNRTSRSGIAACSSTNSTISPTVARCGHTRSASPVIRIIRLLSKRTASATSNVSTIRTTARLDVRFYGSFPLAKFWPELEKQKMREYADTIPETIKQNYIWAWKSDKDHQLGPDADARSRAPRRTISAVPTEEPSILPNQYNFQSVSDWKDLNSKYVLMVWRDYVMSGSKDKAFLQYNFSAVEAGNAVPAPVRQEQRRPDRE